MLHLMMLDILKMEKLSCLIIIIFHKFSLKWYYSDIIFNDVRHFKRGQIILPDYYNILLFRCEI